MKKEIKNIRRKINKYIGSANYSELIINERDDVLINQKQNYNCIINLVKVNNIKKVNEFHNIVNSVIEKNNFYVCCAETIEIRRERLKSNTMFGFKNMIRIVDFIFNRVLPKVLVFKVESNKVISKTEMLGRLIYCGFQPVEYYEFENLFYVISKKNEKNNSNLKPSYSFLCMFERIGLNKETINIYKFRTMYPYSEYLQKDLFKLENLNKDGDKIKDDFRLTTWGKYLRKFWIDETPQLYNIIKGDISIVGVRALSREKFNMYNQELQDLRTKFKPGLLPPYYADFPKDFHEFQISEKKYLKQKIAKPIITDIKYFFIIVINILLKGARSS